MAAKSSVKKSPVAEAGDSPVKAGKSTKQAKSSKPKPSKPSAGRPPGEGMFRETGDIEVSIPLHSIDPAPWNPKPAIFGSYKSGLETSLDYFGNRDRLKVWARPDSIGRYYVLDGNQRLTVLREQAEKQLFDDALDLLCKSRGIDAMDDEKEAEALRKTLAKSLVDDESHERLIRSKAGSYPVPCRVLADLDHADAVAFTTSFDRNSAKFDELKVLANMEFVERAKLSASDRLAKIIRPQRSFVPAVGLPHGQGLIPGRTTGDADPTAPSPLVSPTEDEPWGPPPADTQPDARPDRSSAFPGPSPGPQATLIPIMFAFTPDGYREVQDGILRTKARVVREKRVREALEFMHKDVIEEVEMDDAIVEIALRVYHARHAIAAAGRNELTDVED